MTTTRPLSTALRWRHAATLCTAALVVGSGLIMAPAAFGATTPTPTPSASVTPTDTTPEPSPSPTAGLGSIVAAPRAGGIFQPGSELIVDMRIDNGAAALVAGTATLRIGSAPLADESAISDWLSNDPAGVTLTDVGTLAVDPQAADATTDIEVHGSRILAPLTSLTPGVHPIQVSYVSGTVTYTDNAVITVPEPGDNVSVVVPFTAPAISRGLLSADALAELTAEDGDLTLALHAAQQANVIVVVDPAILASMRALGASAPTSVQNWLDDFDELDNDIFVLPFADADVATLVAAGVADLAPTSLTRYLDASFSPVVDGTTPAPTATPNAAPTLEELLTIDGAVDDLVWPAGGTMTQATAEWAVGEGKTVLVSSAQVDTSQVHVTLEGSGTDALVYDAELSAAVSLAVSEADAVVRNDDLSEVLAQANVTGDGRALIALDRDVEWNEAAATETLGALRDASSGRLAGEVILRAQTAVPAALTGAPEPTDRAAVLTSLLQNEKPLAEMAVVLTDPTLITGAERAEILQLFSVAWLGEKKWDEQIAAHREAVHQTLTAIDIAPVSTIQFLTSGSSIPLQVRNDLPFAATLKLWAQPDDFRLAVESPTTVQAQAGAVTKVLIPVTAGLGNGDVTIRFWLTAENGQEIGGPMYTDVLVRAEWEKFGITALIALVVLLFAGGIYRTVHKRRRERAKVAEDLVEDSAEVEAGAGDSAADSAGSDAGADATSDAGDAEPSTQASDENHKDSHG